MSLADMGSVSDAHKAGFTFDEVYSSANFGLSEVMAEYGAKDLLTSDAYQQGSLPSLTALVEHNEIQLSDVTNILGNDLKELGFDVNQVWAGGNNGETKVEGLFLKDAGFSPSDVNLSQVAAAGFDTDDVSLGDVAAAGFGWKDVEIEQVKAAGFSAE